MYTIAWTDPDGAIYSTRTATAGDAADVVTRIEAAPDLYGLGVHCDVHPEQLNLWTALMERYPFSSQSEDKSPIPHHVGNLEYTTAAWGQHASFMDHLDTEGR